MRTLADQAVPKESLITAVYAFSMKGPWQNAYFVEHMFVQSASSAPTGQKNDVGAGDAWVRALNLLRWKKLES